MSSSLDQRSSKSHEIHDENIASNKETGYEYGPDSQTAYNPAQMGQNADPYYYWHHYHGNPAGSMQEGSWSDREGMYGGYGPMPNHPEYMNPGMYAGYDYSYSWYPNVDPSSGGSWNQQNHYYKRNDYPNGSYYGEQQVDETGEVTASNDYNGDSNGGVQAAEQSFKNMSLSGDGEKDSSNRLSSSGAPAGKKSWANVVNQQPSRSTIPRTSRAIPKAPLAPGWEKGVPSKYSQNSSSRPMAGEGRQVYGGPYSSGGFKPSLAHYGGDAGGDSGNYKAATNNPITSSSGASTGGSSAPVACNFNPNDYNPKDFDLNPKAARFFVIKSFSEDDIHRSIKYSIWCSTEYGNKRLDAAYREREGKGQVFLYFSVNGSGHFCGVAQMTSPIDYSSSSEVWAQNKWKGQFSVKWIYVKDVPNSQLRHIKLENNENKPVTNSRDTQEVPYEKGKQVLRIIHQYRHTTSIFDDFYHYEKQQEDAQHRK